MGLASACNQCMLSNLDYFVMSRMERSCELVIPKGT